MSAILIGVAVAASIILVGVALVLWFRRRQQSSITEALAAVAIARVEHVLVPDGNGGEIHIEHLLLTARGILVIDVKRYEGIVFASDLMDPWTVIGDNGRTTLANPLGSLYDRIAAVRQLIREIDVSGYVLFPAKADFSKGRPEHVLLPDDLLAAYARPDREEAARLREAFLPHWEALKQSTQAAEP